MALVKPTFAAKIVHRKSFKIDDATAVLSRRIRSFPRQGGFVSLTKQA
jgi:hypothetical protein